jgi:hypothetical protein
MASTYLRRLGSRKALAMYLVIALVVAFGAWTAVGAASTHDIETPDYQVVSTHDEYEVRKYEPYIVAEVTVAGGYRESLYSGFRKVADYIFGNNTRADSIEMTTPVLQKEGPRTEKIPMTAPVLHEESANEGSYLVAFIMPKDYTMESLPQPNNEEVQLREVPAKRYAVLRFGAYATEGRTHRKTSRLQDSLTRDGVETIGEPIVAQYNPPWTPPWARRNEILIEIQ